MDNYLIDRDRLERVVDEAMRQRPMNASTPEQLNDLREKAIRALDDRIGLAIFGQLSNEQLTEINTMLADDETTKDEFKDFFDNVGVDFNKVITDATVQFVQEFLRSMERAAEMVH